MTTYSKETALYDTGAIKNGIDEAATTADNYLTDVTGGGVMVHPSDDSTTGWKISSALELLKSGVSYIWAGLVNNIATVRIGKENGGHSVIDENGMRVYGNSDGNTPLANIGYGEGTGSGGGQDDAPYYTLGRRNTITPTVGNYSVVEGNWCTASAYCSHAEGNLCYATGYCSHAEGSNTSSRGDSSHAEGAHTIASGSCSHAEGYHSEALGIYSHAEGFFAIAKGTASHAVGNNTIASGDYSCTLGIKNKEDDNCYVKTSDTSISPNKTYYEYNPDGYYTEVSNPTVGNINNYYEYFADRGKYCVIIGNGEPASSECSNALTVDWDGNVIGKAMAGIIQMFAGSTPPTGWLVCDGSEQLVSDYPELAAVLQNTWGTPSSSDYFKLPDFRGRAPIGAGTGSGLTARTLGGSIGSENIQAHTHGFTQPKTPNHTHTMTYVGDAASNISGTNPSNLGSVVRRTTSSSDTTNWTSNSTGGGVACTGGAVGAVSGASTGNAGNMQPSAVVNFIICTGKTY